MAKFFPACRSGIVNPVPPFIPPTWGDYKRIRVRAGTDCRRCGKTFKSNTEFAFHKQFMCRGKEEPELQTKPQPQPKVYGGVVADWLTCKQCGEEYSRFRRAEEPSKNGGTGYCSRPCKAAAGLIAPMTSSKDWKYVCDGCGRKYRYADTLKAHKSICRVGVYKPIPYKAKPEPEPKAKERRTSCAQCGKIGPYGFGNKFCSKACFKQHVRGGK